MLWSRFANVKQLSNFFWKLAAYHHFAEINWFYFQQLILQKLDLPKKIDESCTIHRRPM